MQLNKPIDAFAQINGFLVDEQFVKVQQNRVWFGKQKQLVHYLHALFTHIGYPLRQELQYLGAKSCDQQHNRVLANALVHQL